MLSGPRTLNVTKKFSHIPMWHRQGGLVVTTDSKALRIEEQDWRQLTIEAWPSATGATNSSRTVYLGDNHITFVLSSDGGGGVSVHAAANPGSTSDGAGTHDVGVSSTSIDVNVDAWLLRLHLAPGERLTNAVTDGGAEQVSGVRHIEPSAQGCAGHFPFSGAGSAPACAAGPIAEVQIEVKAAVSRQWGLRAFVAAGAPAAGGVAE